MTTYLNPRKHAKVEDWPLGKYRRGAAIFQVEEDPKHGERVSRVTTGKPRKTTYAKRFVIVDGDDGKTYLLAMNLYGSIEVWPGTMKFPVSRNAEEHPEEYKHLLGFLYPEKEAIQ